MSFRIYFGKTMALAILYFVPAIQPRTQKAEHPKVAVPPEFFHPAAFSEYVPSQAPAIPNRINISPLDK
jgi:hypothetical protein